MLTISEIIVLGTAVPEQTKNNGKTVCVAGWADDLGFVRIYPCRADYGIKRWSRLRNVRVKRNPKDNRIESYKLDSERSFDFGGSIESPHDKIDLMDSVKQNCVYQVRDNMLSLGLIKINSPIEYIVDENPLFSKQESIATQDDKYQWLLTKQDFALQPKFKFFCGDRCFSKKGHSLSVIEWGGFEWVRKFPDKINNLADNWKINNPAFDIYVLVGNMAQFRNSFIIISVIPVKKKLDLTLPLFPGIQKQDKPAPRYTIQRSVSGIVSIVRSKKEHSEDSSLFGPSNGLSPEQGTNS